MNYDAWHEMLAKRENRISFYIVSEFVKISSLINIVGNNMTIHFYSEHENGFVPILSNH